MSATSAAIRLGLLCVLPLIWTGVCSQHVEDNAKVARTSYDLQTSGTKTPQTTAENLKREKPAPENLKRGRPAPEDLQRERPAPEDLKVETEQFLRGFYDPTEERNELQSSYINLAKQRDQLMIRYNNLIKERIQLQTVCTIVSYIREKNQFQSRLNNLTRERDQIQTRYNNVTHDRDQLQTRYNNLTTEQYQLQTSYDNLIQERDQLQTSYNILTKERDLLQISCNNLTKDKDQFQTSYSTATTRITELQKEAETLAPLARSCPVGWGKFGSSCYLISYGSKTWQESSNDCEAKGAHLVIINSREEQAFVSAQTNSQRVWIGLYDPYGNRNFRWVDGSSLTTWYWASGEPNNYNGTPENCVEIYIFGEPFNGWNDQSCNYQSNWVCEL